jgi:RHS repeat-associated protein
VVDQTDCGGALTWQAAYEAYGTRTAEAGSNPDRQRANTKDEEPFPRLLNEGMRYRDLQTGTFLTRDPAGFVDGPNLYTYVRQNPWTKFDPLGLKEETVAGVTPTRDGHHISPVATWDKNGSGENVQNALDHEDFRITSQDPDLAIRLIMDGPQLIVHTTNALQI